MGWRHDDLDLLIPSALAFPSMNGFARSTVLVALLALAFGCRESAKKPAPASPTPAEATTKSASLPKAEGPAHKYTLDPSRSEVSFIGKKITGQHTGVFKKVSGEIELRGEVADNGVVRVSIDLASVKTDDDELDDHLRSKDFFDVERFPTATFASTALAPSQKPGTTHTIYGNLTLHGVTRPFAFPATITIGTDTVTANAELAIDRKDYGIVYPGLPDDLISDEVMIRFAITARRDQAS
jgi:polyisoprenoid-binding protein YceI